MSKEEGNNSFLRGNQRCPPVFSNPDGQASSGLAPKQNQTGKEKKELAATTANNNRKPNRGKAKVQGKAAKHEKGISRDDNKEEKGSESDHEIHILTERERRKKMRTMFSNLHALLPQLPPKADKSTIVDEAVSHIKTLEQTLGKLEEKKRERENQGKNALARSREAFIADQVSSNNHGTESADKSSSSSVNPASFATWTSPNVVMNICDGEAQISVCYAKKAGLFSAVCYVLEKHNIEVLSAHVSSDCFDRRFYMIQARVNGGANQLGEGIPAEEIYKQAANEIIVWIHS